MACAKAIKQLSKYMPLSDEMQDAVASDEKIITDKAFTNTKDGLDVNMMESPEETFEDAQEVDPQDLLNEQIEEEKAKESK